MRNNKPINLFGLMFFTLALGACASQTKTSSTLATEKQEEAAIEEAIELAATLQRVREDYVSWPPTGPYPLEEIEEGLRSEYATLRRVAAGTLYKFRESKYVDQRRQLVETFGVKEEDPRAFELLALHGIWLDKGRKEFWSNIADQRAKENSPHQKMWEKICADLLTYEPRNDQ